MQSTALLGMAAALLLLPGVASGRATRAQRMRLVSNTTIAFSDDPLTAGVTAVKAAHLTELRDAVNLARTTVGLPASIFTDQPPDGLAIKGTHIAALRTAFDEARSALGYPTMSYTDPNITTSTKIRAMHFQELRDAVRMLINCPSITVSKPAATTFTVNAPLTQFFMQSGATNGSTFTVVSGALPDGLTLSSAGVLMGIPTQTGSFPIRVGVIDGNGCSGLSPTYQLGIVPPPVIFTFTGSPIPVAPGTTVTLTGTFSDGTGLITDNQGGQPVVAVSGAGYQVAPTVTTLYTLTVTNAAGTQVSASVAVEMAAVVRINEVNANIGSQCDLIELRVIFGGNMAGVKLTERTGTVASELSFTFPSFTVQKNAFIIVHMNSGIMTCNPAPGATQELVTPLDQPSSTYVRNFDTAFDFYSTDNGLISTDNVLTVFAAEGSIIDALFVSNDPAGTLNAAATEAAAAVVGAANQWSPALSAYPGALFRMNAVSDLDATGTTVSGNSIQRLDNTDDNNIADWTTGAGATSTWGLLNVGQSPLP